MNNLEVLNKYAHYKTSQCANKWRWYGPEDKLFSYPSVSSIQRETIPNSLDQIPKDKLEAAGDFGTRCHEAFEMVANGEVPAYIDTTIVRHVAAFKEWQSKHEVRFLAQEFTVVSEKYGFAGRVDALAEVDGKIELLDWKTGNQYKDDWASQVGAYTLALTEMLGCDSNQIGARIVQIKRDTAELKEFRFEHIDFIQDSFLLCLERFKRAPRFTKLKKIGWDYITKKAMIRV